MTQAAFNGKRGFVFHDACWSLLERAHHPSFRVVPLQRLFELLDSLPMTTIGTGLDWGHEYGGVFCLLGDKDDYFPWEYSWRFAERDFGPGRPGSAFTTNPLGSSEVESILAEPRQEPPRPPRRSFSPPPCPSSQASFGRDMDIFHSLPEELCCAIATYLPTADLLNARLASRSFWDTFASQQFWASRFNGGRSAGAERSWLFEALSGTIGPAGAPGRGVTTRDWRWLYRRTVDARLGPAARNRKRVWGLIHDIMELLDLSWNELPPPGALPWLCQPSPALPDPHQETEASPRLSWIVAAGCIREGEDGFGPLRGASTRVKSQRVAIPADGMARIGTWTIRHGGATYIAGLSITPRSGQILRLGYTAAAAAPGGTCIDLDNDAVLTGFNVALGPAGIHALQAVSSGSRGGTAGVQLSAWLGNPEDGPRTERLSAVVADGKIMVLEFGFDVR